MKSSFVIYVKLSSKPTLNYTQSAGHIMSLLHGKQ